MNKSEADLLAEAAAICGRTPGMPQPPPPGVPLTPQAEAALISSRCWSCHCIISISDNYCRHCGKGQGDNIPWRYKHQGIIFYTLIIGPFSLVFVWKSPLLSRTAKIVYTVLLCAATWLLYTKIKDAVYTAMSAYTGSPDLFSGGM
ncbi:MAG: hypothetical protein WC421_09495 [Elusimicrobiales bacterium]